MFARMNGWWSGGLTILLAGAVCAALACGCSASAEVGSATAESRVLAFAAEEPAAAGEVAAPGVEVEVPGIRDAQGKRVVPFYGLFCWASDFANPQYTDLILETGFGLISTPLNESQEAGILLAARHGIDIAGYYSPNAYGPTLDLDGYRQAVRKAVRRYGPRGSLWSENPDIAARPVIYWVIDGEPGTELKPPGEMMPDEAFAKFLKVAHEELKAWSADCQVVALAPIGVVEGGMPGPEYVDDERKIMGGRAFIRGVHKHGGFDHYDCLDIHPFSFPLPPDSTGLAKALRELQAEMAELGQVRPIWFTEIGFPLSYGPANPFHVTRDQAADYMIRGLAIAARHNVQCLTLTYVNDQFSPRRAQGFYLYKGYGLYTRNKTVRPAGKVVKLMIDLLPDPRLLEVISDGENIGEAASRWSDRPFRDSAFYCYKFRGRNDSEVYVLWTEGKPFRYNLKVPGEAMVLYNRELLGGVVYSRENGSIGASGEMRVPVTGTPIFVSTEVSEEQKKLTRNYLSPTDYREWNQIEGAED